MAGMGRPSIFGPKSSKYRRQGIMTKVGSKLFEMKRSELATLANVSVKSVSDGDVFEFLARGRESTVEYLASRT